MHPSKWLGILGGLCLLFLIGGFAWQQAQLQACLDRLDAAEGRVPSPSPAAQPAPATATQEIAALRRELRELRDLLQARPAATASRPALAASVVVADDEERARLKQVVAEVLEAREAEARSRNEKLVQQFAANGPNFFVDHQKTILDQLEQRIKLSAFQKEQIGKLLEERRSTVPLASPPPDPEAMMKKMAEADEAFDKDVKGFLTSSQATDYDAWKQETGGFHGGQVMIFSSGAIGTHTIKIEAGGK